MRLCRRHQALDAKQREVLSSRARTCFEAYYHRPPGEDPRDPATLEGIELALMDLDGRKSELTR